MNRRSVGAGAWECQGLPLSHSADRRPIDRQTDRIARSTARRRACLAPVHQQDHGNDPSSGPITTACPLRAASAVWSAAKGFRDCVEPDKEKRNLPTVGENGMSGPVFAPAARWLTRRCVQRVRISQTAARQADQATSPVLKCGQRPCSYFPERESIQPWYIGQMAIHRGSGTRPKARELQSRCAGLCGFPFPSRMLV